MSNYTTETRLLDDTRDIVVMMKKKTTTLPSGLKIESFFVKDMEGGKPYEVAVLGTDADLVPGGCYTVMLRERKQTRVADGATFIELQVAGAMAG